MDSSQVSLSSEWDIVSSYATSEDESPLESIMKELNPDDVPDLTERDFSKESCMDNVQKGSGLDDLPNDLDDTIHNDSASDIDVIDEIPDGNECDMSIPLLDYSLSSSLESKPANLAVCIDPTPPVASPPPELPAAVPPPPEIPAAVPPPPEIPEAVPPPAVAPSPLVILLPAVRYFGFLNHPRIQQLQQNFPFHEFMLVIAIILLVTPSMKYPEMDEMKEQLVSLQAENNDLKNQVLSKIEDDKLFIALEDQIKALKGENSKLSSSLKSLILKLEEQTSIFQKENLLREKDPYKAEIDKLKEQVNVLQIDNDELQKQLVRMRYGAYSPYAEEAKPDVREEPKDGVDQKDKKIENTSEVLSEEIKELRKKLYAEVEKLKEWKDSIQFLMKKLSNVQEGTDKQDGQDRKSNRKGKRFHERMWKALKNNFEGTLDSLPNIELPDVFSKYVDQKRVEDVFESVGHYFKKAQEKTKKLFDYNEDVRNNFWDVLGDLRKKWGDVKNEFFKRNYGKGESSDENGNRADFSPDHPARSQYFESDKKSKVHKDKDYQEAGNNEEKSQDSWMFERAAHRSELRENEQEEEEDIYSNWFLRKRPDAVNV